MQRFSVEDGVIYDNDERYAFIFHTRDELDNFSETGMIKKGPRGYVSAVSEAFDYWDGWEAPKEENKVFVTIHQLADIKDLGFIKVEVVDERDCSWTEKWDNDYEEYRLDRDIYIATIGYFCMTRVSPVRSEISMRIG